MTGFGWAGFMIGVLVGGVLGALFFAGLAWSMKIALRHPNPAAILLPSAALRIAALLAGGWAVTAWAGVAGAIGFAVAFVVLRTVLLARLRRALRAENA